MYDQQESPTMLFNESKPASIRLWHWLALLFFIASITTVIFGSTLFKTKSNIQLVQEQVQQNGGSVTEKQAWSVAHEYSDKLWMLHKNIGYGLSFLLLYRILVEIAFSKEKKLFTHLRKALSYPVETKDRNHFLLVQYGYLIFYGLFILMSLSGLILAVEEVQWLEPLHKPAEKIHSIIQYGLYAYMLVHIMGVVRADLTNYGGIISRMINGKETK